ncbi:hypothetical protein [Roseateles oligotrophus]|uniref:DUF5808 domain-containing protein n=1 Tax=Roseateles oligotrophus TaxID=1769250 RepID=A0ABT2YKJ9_9BURK|nr:hypothetical protein [Roseateles oligotrophus]MCV2370486.1 hypothetical protein [Roseateles oligotrophus]
MTTNTHQTSQTKGIWFPAKRYGWGWGLPIRWQGWVVLVVYVGLMSLMPYLLSPERQAIAFFSSVTLLTALLLLICWRKGERARWHWGASKSD